MFDMTDDPPEMFFIGIFSAFEKAEQISEIMLKEVKRNDHVIVETARGIEYGTVVGNPKEIAEDQVV